MQSIPKKTNAKQATRGQSKNSQHEGTSLDDVTSEFQKWLYLRDRGAVLVYLAALIANMMQGDPVWLQLIGPPSSGKSEIIQSGISLPDVHSVSVLTEAALLSGTSRAETSFKSKGGLLNEIGDFGLILVKDFTSILSMNRDKRASVLAALREIYDGSWVRLIGSDGGRKLTWHGKIGLIAGCTSSIDTLHSVVSVMGERFVYYRMPKVIGQKVARRALRSTGRETLMRNALRKVVEEYVSALQIPTRTIPLSKRDENTIVELATLVARCRSPVVRDSYKREIDMIPDSEVPARLSRVLVQSWRAFEIMGVEPGVRKKLLVKIGFDSMPQQRRDAFKFLARSQLEWTTTQEVAREMKLPEQTTRRVLEDLAAHGVVKRLGEGQGKTCKWRLSKWARNRMNNAEIVFSNRPRTRWCRNK